MNCHNRYQKQITDGRRANTFIEKEQLEDIHKYVVSSIHFKPRFVQAVMLKQLTTYEVLRLIKLEEIVRSFIKIHPVSEKMILLVSCYRLNKQASWHS